MLASLQITLRNEACLKRSLQIAVLFPEFV